FALLKDNFDDIISIEKGTLVLPGGGYPDEAEFAAFFPIGAYNYSTQPLNGIELQYTDETGDYWSTAYGAADQTGSSFKVTQRKIQGGGDIVKIMATFNCKLYDGSG